VSFIPSNEPPGPVPADVATTRRLQEIGPGGLRRRAARGTVINGVWLIAVSTLSSLNGVLVAGLLGPEAFGLWGLLTISFGTLFVLGAIGLDDKYIQQDHPDQQAAFEVAFTLQTLYCGLFLLLGLIAIPLFSLLYGVPEILVPGLVLSLAFPLLALQTPIWVFYRRMDFLRQRLLQSVEPLITVVVTTTLALAGVGLWSLVIGAITGTVAVALVAVRNSPYKLRFRYERRALSEYASFSWPLLLGSLTAVLTVQIPVTIASRSLGVAAVGAITLATSVASYTKRVDDIVTQALYPAICAVKDRGEVLFEAFSKSNRLALIWGFPCGVGLALFGGDIVHFVLGADWEHAIPLVQVLGLAAAVDQIGFNWTAFARARGETRPLAVAGVAGMVVVSAVAVPLLMSHGVVGYAVALGAGTLAVMAVRIAYLIRIFPAFRIFTHLSRATLPTVPAALLVLAGRALVVGDSSPWRLVAEAVVFASLVIAGTFVAERALLREAVGYLGLKPRSRHRAGRSRPRARSSA
jgi:O-antigen/teichoic acid export membrane protein